MSHPTHRDPVASRPRPPVASRRRRSVASRPRPPATFRPRPLVAFTSRRLAALLTAPLVALLMAGAVPGPAGVLDRDPPGSGAPTGRVAQPEPSLLGTVHREAAHRGPVHRGAGHSAGVAERGAPPEASIRWRRSRALGRPDRGRLAGGVQLPAEGTDFVTVDPVRRTSPNPGRRRWGTDRLVRVLLRVAAEHAAAHPGAPRLVVGDLSRPRGGRFGPEFGGDGHRSHQNGLDVDVYYPRRDGREKVPGRVGQIDRRLAQELVDRLVRAGAQYVFVGPRTGLHGPAKVVMVLGNHDDHLHVRLRPAARDRR
jgi:Penicillin-insensitive murein endopeptidase